MPYTDRWTSCPSSYDRLMWLVQRNPRVSVTISNISIYHTVNSAFHARWLASSEVISQVLFTSEQPKKKNGLPAYPVKYHVYLVIYNNTTGATSWFSIKGVLITWSNIVSNQNWNRSTWKARADDKMDAFHSNKNSGKFRNWDKWCRNFPEKFQ